MRVNTKHHKGSWRPSPLQELLLRAALLKGEDAVAAWREWKACIDVEKLDPASHRMLPLLYRNLQTLGVEDPSLGIYKGVYRQTWYKNHILFHTIESLIHAFHEAGIETIALKGAALAVLYYKDNGLRPMKDFDVLIRMEDVIPAIELLRRLGWEPIDFIPDSKYISVSYSHGFRNSAGAEFDLHWHLLSQSRRKKADNDFWDGAISTRIRDAETRALNPTDQLLHVCIHGARWNSIAPFRWVADAATVMNSAHSEIDWNRLLEQARKRRLVLPLKDSLNYLRYVMGAPVSLDALRDLRGMHVPKIDRIEYKINISPPTRWKAMLDLWCQHSRLIGDANPFYKLLRFPKFLECIWGRSLWQMPFYGISRIMKWKRNETMG